MSTIIDGAVPCRVTFPAHIQIGGGDPYEVKERSYEALYNGAILTSRPLEGGWEFNFNVEGRPALGDKPIVRYMTNHGTYAARVGGNPVVIERL